MSTFTSSRWAALGAAAAVTLGAGGLMTASADVSSGDRPTFVSITPCRIADTRPAPDKVGARAGALTAGETYTFTVRGTNGNCTIPADALGVIMNVAAVSPTAASFFTLFPSDAPRPLSANLNFIANQPPVSNTVAVKLSSAGQVSIFNLAGTVQFAADLVGYYVNHNHDDRYYTKSEIDAKVWGTNQVADGAITSAKILDGTVGTAELASNSVTSAKIADSSIVAADLADDSVTSAEILDATVGTGDLANDSVTSAKVLDDTLTAADLGPDSVNSAEIANDAVTASELAAGSIGAEEVTDFGLTNQDIAVLTAEISATGVVADQCPGCVFAATKLGLGQYEVDFGRDITACSFFGTLGGSTAGVTADGFVSMVDRVGNVNAVSVITRNIDGTAADKPFHVLVVC